MGFPGFVYFLGRQYLQEKISVYILQLAEIFYINFNNLLHYRQKKKKRKKNNSA